MGSQGFQNLTLQISAQQIGADQLKLIEDRVNAVGGSVSSLEKQLQSFGDSSKRLFTDPLGLMADKATDLLKKLGPLGIGITATAGTLAAVSVAGTAAAKDLGELADRIEDIGARTGLSTKEVQQFDLAMKYVGGSIDTMDNAMKGLSRALSDNSDEGKKALRALEDLKVSARDTEGNLKPAKQLWLELSDAFNKVGSAAERNRLAMDLFGRAGLSLAADIGDLREAMERASRHPVLFSDADLKQMDEFRRTAADIEHQWERLKVTFEKPLAATVKVSLDWFEDQDRQRQEFQGMLLRQNKDSAYGTNPGGPLFIDVLGVLNRKLGVTPNTLTPDQLWSARQDQKASFASAQDMISRFTSSYSSSPQSLQDSLARAKSEEQSLAAQIQGLKGTDVRSEAVARLEQRWAAAGAEVRKYEAAIKSLHDTEVAAGKIQSTLDELSQSVDLGMNPFLKDTRKRLDALNLLPLNRSQSNQAFGDLGMLMETESSKEFGKLGTEWSKAVREAQKQRTEYFDEQWSDLYKRNDDRAARAAAAVIGFGQSSIDIRSGRQVDQANREFSETSRIGQLLNPGGSTIEANYQSQLALARQLFVIEDQRIRAQSKYFSEEDRNSKVAELNLRARAELEKATDQARMDRQVAYAELLNKQRQDNKETGGRLFDAAMAGGGGIERYLQAFGLGQVRTVFSNSYAELAGGLSGKFKLPGQLDSDGNLNRWGRVLQGSAFGVDRNQMAMDANTRATLVNTDAVASLSRALGAPAGTATGGGFSLPSFGGSGGFGGIVPGVTAGSTPPFIGDGGSSGFGTLSSLFGLGGGTSGSDSTLFIPGAPTADIGTMDRLGMTAPASPNAAYSPGPSAPSNLGNNAVRAAGLALAGFGVYSGIKQGGGKGALMATSSALAGAAMFPGPQQPFLMAGAMVTGLIGTLLGDPKEKRRKQLEEEQFARTYRNAANGNYTSGTTYSVGVNGLGVDYDYTGGARSSTIVQVHTMDAKSFLDNAPQIAGAVRLALNTDQPLISAVKQTAYGV